MQITDLVRDSPLRDLGTILSQCAHVVVPRDGQDSFEYDPEEEVNIEKEKDGDSDESDEDYVPEGASGGLGESDGEGDEIQEDGVGEIQKEGVGEIQEEGVGEIQKEGVGEIQEEGAGEIQKEGVGVIQKEGVGEIQKEGEGSGMGKGMWGKGKGMSGVRMGAVGMGCKRQPKEIEHRYRKCKNIVRECPATLSPSPKCHVQKDPHKNVVPRSPGVHIKKKMPLKNTHHVEGMAEYINIRDAVSTNIGWYYKCKECTFECATRAACVAHTCRKHTDELIGPYDYCRRFYAHSADTMKHHVNECAGSTTGSDDNDD